MVGAGREAIVLTTRYVMQWGAKAEHTVGIDQGSEIAIRRMTALAIVEHFDIFKYGCLRCFVCVIVLRIDQFRLVVYLQRADKYHRLTHRLSQGQKGLDERAIMTSPWSSHPW
jgi:hypothetical protein